jgi:hypothetical protein
MFVCYSNFTSLSLPTVSRLCPHCYIQHEYNVFTFTLPKSLLADPATGKAVGPALAHLLWPTCFIYFATADAS